MRRKKMVSLTGETVPTGEDIGNYVVDPPLVLGVECGLVEDEETDKVVGELFACWLG